MDNVKKIARRFLLKDNHPTAIKVEKLFALADELGISISFGNQMVVVRDKDRNQNLPTLYAIDIEEDHWFNGFPFATEYKLVYENPEYIAQQEAEREERIRLRDEERRLIKEKEDAFIRAKAQEQEAQERQLLSQLKEKYHE